LVDEFRNELTFVVYTFSSSPTTTTMNSFIIYMYCLLACSVWLNLSPNFTLLLQQQKETEKFLLRKAQTANIARDSIAAIGMGTSQRLLYQQKTATNLKYTFAFKETQQRRRRRLELRERV